MVSAKAQMLNTYFPSSLRELGVPTWNLNPSELTICPFILNTAKWVDYKLTEANGLN